MLVLTLVYVVRAIEPFVLRQLLQCSASSCRDQADQSSLCQNALRRSSRVPVLEALSQIYPSPNRPDPAHQLTIGSLRNTC